MPTTTYWRTWCKTCNDWTLHTTPFNATKDNPERDWECRECGTVFTSLMLSEIPYEKLKEQRERYKKDKTNQFGHLFSSYMFSSKSYMDDIFSEVGSNVTIKESDAGQEGIDKEIAKIREEEYNKRREERLALEIEFKKYAHLGRNDKCACGSGLKYKKCCQSKFEY